MAVFFCRHINHPEKNLNYYGNLVFMSSIEENRNIEKIQACFFQLVFRHYLVHKYYYVC